MADKGGRAGKNHGKCKLCGVEGRVFQCSMCHSVFYCCAECQKKDWKAHKKVCKQMADDYVAQESASALERHAQGRYETSRKRLERVVEVRQAHGGGDEVGLATALVHAGTNLIFDGRYDEALVKLTEALGMCKRLFGDGANLLTADALHQIGQVYIQHSKCDAALKKLGDALRMQVLLLGANHPTCASTMSAIGTVHYRQRNLPKALEVYRAGLAIVQGRADQRMTAAKALNNVGNVLTDMGRLDEASEALDEALRIKQELLGREHPDVAGTLCNIGHMRTVQGRFEEALGVHKEVLRIQKKMLGRDHPALAGTHHNIGIVLLKQEKPSEALPFFKEALRSRKSRLGDEHQDVGRSHVRVGDCHSALGELKEAANHLTKACKILSKAPGVGRVEVADVYYSTAKVCRRLGWVEEANEMFGESSCRYAREYGPDDARAVDALAQVHPARPERPEWAQETANLERYFDEQMARAGAGRDGDAFAQVHPARPERTESEIAREKANGRSLKPLARAGPGKEGDNVMRFSLIP